LAAVDSGLFRNNQRDLRNNFQQQKWLSPQFQRKQNVTEISSFNSPNQLNKMKKGDFPPPQILFPSNI